MFPHTTDDGVSSLLQQQQQQHPTLCGKPGGVGETKQQHQAMHFVNNVPSWDHHHSLLLLHAAATGGLPPHLLQQQQQQVSPKKPQPFPATAYHHQVVVVEAAGQQLSETETKRRRRIQQQQQQQQSILPSSSSRTHHQLCYPSTNGVLRIPQQLYRPTSTNYRDPSIDQAGDEVRVSSNEMRTTKLLPSSTKGQQAMPVPLQVHSGPSELLPAASTTRTTASQHQEEKADVLLTTASTRGNSTQPTTGLSPEAQEALENAQKNLASLLGAYKEALRTYDKRHNSNTKKSAISRTSSNDKNKRPRSSSPARSNTGVVPTTGRVLLLEGVVHHEQRHVVTNGNHEVESSSGPEPSKMARPSRGPPKKRRMVA